MDGLLMIAMNKHREICSIQSSGGIMLLKEQVSTVQTHSYCSLRISILNLISPQSFTNIRHGRKTEELKKNTSEVKKKKTPCT